MESNIPMIHWKAKYFVEYIDKKYIDAKKNKISRLDIEWGKWSREMNVILRDRINSKKDPEELRLKHVIFYWTTKSQILEFYYKNRVLNAGKIKRRSKEAKKIRESIITGKGLKEFELNKELTSKILNKK